LFRFGEPNNKVDMLPPGRPDQMQNADNSGGGASLFLPVECEPDWLDAGLADTVPE
jgi:hypothetical protein